MRTPWPLFIMGIAQSNLVGALFVLGFLRFGLPPSDRVELTELGPTRLIILGFSLFILFVVGAIVSTYLLLPVLRWQYRSPDFESEGSEAVRVRALQMPFYRTVISVATWLVGGAIFVAVTWSSTHSSVLVAAFATVLGATTTSIIGYLQSERVLRPVAIQALRRSVPENVTAPGVIVRQILTWALSTGVPILAIVLTVVGQRAGYLKSNADNLTGSILILAIIALAIGLMGTLLVATSIADPLRQLRWALSEVQRGNYNAHVPIYDASELGLLQAGFNDMVRDLGERPRLRDLFGRYVGEDVARRALEYGTELGGQERSVAVLFVDLVGSTQLASTRGPAVVVRVLNEFFRVIVDTVNKHGGFVNKFQGDAALAIFGAPIDHPDGAAAALAAARELSGELTNVLGSNDFGIGVSAGRAIAGHIGAQARFEYTVIGDPVNEAARLTELAKNEPGNVLASASAVMEARDEEALRWDVGETVELRGRTVSTQVARPRHG